MRRNDFTIITEESAMSLFGGTIAYKLFETSILKPCSIPGINDRNEAVHPCKRYLSNLQNDDLLSKIHLPEPVNTDQLDFFKEITTSERFWLGFFTKTSKDQCDSDNLTAREYFQMSNPKNDPILWVNDNWAPNEPNQCGEYFLEYELGSGLRDISTDNTGWKSQIICVYVEKAYFGTS